MSTGELPRRVAVAVVGIPVVLGTLHVGGWALGVLLALFAAIGSAEFSALVRAAGGRPWAGVGAVGAAALVLLATAQPSFERFAPGALALTMSVGLVLLGVAVWTRWPGGRPLGDTAATVLGMIYTGGALAFAPLLRALPGGEGVEGESLRASALVLLPLLTTWAGDSAAYFVGRSVGRTKLAPAASPGKTVEGGLAGLVGSVAAAGALALWAPDAFARLGVSMPLVLLFGLLLGAAGQVGDLAESVLKREAGVKDSGRILPGHGGALDRLDALLFTIPLAWILLQLPGAFR